MIGIPELSPTEQHKGKLLKDGIYRAVRHPRYLSAGLSVIALLSSSTMWACMS